MTTRFFRQPNLATDRVYPIDAPWDFAVPEDVLKMDKNAYKTYYKKPETDHCLLYMAKGFNAEYTITSENQAAVLYGFMADYDGILTDDLIDEIKKHRQSRFLPAYWCKSHSDKLHLFWFFEKPFSVAGNAHANQLLQVVARNIKAAKWAVGYDTSCENVTQCIDVGYGWQKFSDDTIPHEELVMWDFALWEAGAGSKSRDVVSIPFDVVADEVKKREWPHKIPLNFQIGTRCVRFWDASADNVSGAQITKDGIRVYTPHDNGFKSWRSLLGNDFCDQYVAKSTAPFVDQTFYWHTKDAFYRQFPADEARRLPARYEQRTEKVLRREMIIEAQLSDKVPKGDEVSPVARMLDVIIKRNTVDAVAPLIYREAGPQLLPEIGKRVLNTSTVVAHPMAGRLVAVTKDDLARYPNCPQKYKDDPNICAWDNPFAVERFPHIHRLITTYFMPSQTALRNWVDNGYELHSKSGTPVAALNDPQLKFLISWCAHFYKNAVRQRVNPDRGQALIIAGPPSVGKSFFVSNILAQLFGGSKDAAEFYLGGGRFNSDIMASPIHVIDDRLGCLSRHARLKFTEALKVVVANGRLRYEAKFSSSMESVPWPGRVVILANDDQQSMSVMPDLDMSTRDKFMMIKFGPAQFPFGTTDENQKWLADELSYFAKFLFSWEIPADIRDNRFGVRAVQHKDMAQAAAENGLTHTVLQVLESCIEASIGHADNDAEEDEIAIEGNPVKIFKWIKSIDDSYARECIDSRLLHQCLTTLFKNGSYNLSYDEHTKRWRIPYKLRKEVKQC